ncbi:aminoglycoside phosphotransferase family protein [Ruania alkalisoli]|uniref:Aminoglycoside phosphotransferase family protein n=1 Tax=Ruania alkalisoli TaxID=2779775 RepID=A0A7M1SVB6_9MICO|nr:aminoglycoside phosphotransferase family protein [Ruania alkalisoli]QOR70904.1 aminoglycoside phosphotransferase family protein [Ruania alkalisoli]
MAGTPAAEVHIDEDLVRRLLADQHPELAERPLRVVANGWDNVMVRLGSTLLARLPRREAAARLVEHEQLVLPRLAPLLPVPVPEPVRVGRPTAYYPWAWSIVRWIEGRPAAHDPALARDAWAARLGKFFAALHRPADPDAPANPVRGVPLAERAEAIRARLADPAVPRREELAAVFERHAHVPAYSGPPVWVHGDPHPLNLLTHRHRLTAVLDFGDVTAGDPATDLATAWLTFTARGRAAFVVAYATADRTGSGLPDGYGGDDALWSRARAWAASLAGVFAAHADDDPCMAAIAEHSTAELLDAADVR